MKTTLDIPDDLYRQVEAKSARQGRCVRDVTVELYRKWLDEGPAPATTSAQALGEQWLAEFLAVGRAEMDRAPPGPTAREILDAGRGRLEPRRP